MVLRLIAQLSLGPTLVEVLRLMVLHLISVRVRQLEARALSKLRNSEFSERLEAFVLNPEASEA